MGGFYFHINRQVEKCSFIPLRFHVHFVMSFLAPIQVLTGQIIICRSIGYVGYSYWSHVHSGLHERQRNNWTVGIVRAQCICVCLYVCVFVYVLMMIYVCVCVRVRSKTKEQLTFTNYTNNFLLFSQIKKENKDLCQDHLISSVFLQLYHNILHCSICIRIYEQSLHQCTITKVQFPNDYCESNKTNFTIHILAPIDKNDNRLQLQQK